MTTIRILHISDLHLAEQPGLRSILDRSKGMKAAVKKTLLSDIKESVLSGKPYQLRGAFKDLLEDDNIKALRRALDGTSREQINNAIDEVLTKVALGDGSFKKAAAQFLRDQTFASSFDSRLLDCLCNFIEDEDPNLSAIIITGDLATTGFRVDLTRGLSFLEGPSDPSISQVSFDKKLLLPGNHDRYIYTPDGFLYAPGGQLFDATFKDYWSGPVMAYKPLRSGELSVIIIAADFSLKSKNDCTLPLLKVSRLAQGRVYPEMVNQIVDLTKRLKDREQNWGYIPIVMWAIHFPPFFVHTNSGWMAQVLYKLTKNLLNEKLLAREARNQKVQRILAGHTHEAQIYLMKKFGVKVLCAGSATQDDPGNKQCQIIEVTLDATNKPQITPVEYEPDMSATTFRPTK